MQYLEILSTGISVISLIIVVYGAVIAFCAFIRNESRRLTGKYSFTATRTLRADLGGVVVLRTILSIFLNKEIKELQTEKEEN